MDPNITLEELRRLSDHILTMTDAENTEPDVDIGWEDARSLAEYVQALDGWISRGGFLPAEWMKGR